MNPTSKMTRRFVLGIAAIAVATVPFVPVVRLGERPLLVLLLMASACLAGASRVRIPRLRVHMSAADPFILCALAAVGPMAASMVAAASVVGAALRPGGKPAPIQFAFNLAVVFLTTAASSAAFLALGGQPGSSLALLLAPLAGAAAIYFVVNTGLVSVVIAIDGRQPYVETWRRTFLWTPPAYLGGLTLAVAMLAVLDFSLPWTLALALAPCPLLVAFFRAHPMRGGTDGQAERPTGAAA